jgi:hypothetical protein
MAKAKTPKASSAPEKVDLGVYLEEVQAKAFEIYQTRTQNGIAGDEMGDWFQAELAVKKLHNLDV